jgi:hypothetical protein
MAQVARFFYQFLKFIMVLGIEIYTSYEGPSSKRRSFEKMPGHTSTEENDVQ